MTGLIQDLRDGARAMRHAPAFTATVVLTLALGIGVNTAVFSVVSAALFRPLPYADPDALVRVAEWPETGGNYTMAPAAFVYVRERSRAFSGLEAMISSSAALFTGGDPISVRGARVTAGYFELLGVRAERGRTFTAAADSSGDSGCAVVVGHQLWTSRFQADPDIVGRSLQLDAGPCTVIGVLPVDAIFNRAAADVYLPLRLGGDAGQQQGRTLSVIGRLAPDVALERAGRELADVIAPFNAVRGPAGRGWTTALTPLQDALVRADTRRLAWVLLATVGAVLLVACVNVAGLTLARTLDRRRDVAVRAALGASRARLFRGLVIEGVLLAVTGGGVALLVGAWTMRAFVALLPPALLPAAGASLDGFVLLFTMALSIVTGLAFGTLPAWHGSSTAAREALSSGGRSLTASRATSRLRGALVVAEVALATTLAIGAAMLVASFSRLSQVDPGFSAAEVLTFPLRLPPATYQDDGALVAGFGRVLDALRAVPGVTHASAVTSLPLGGWLYGAAFTVEGEPPAGPLTSAHIQSITREYFATLGIPLASGREFTARDETSPARVAVVNQTFMRRHIPPGPVLGRRILLSGTPFEIVGVARDVKTGGLADAPLATPEIYVPLAQAPSASLFVAVRTHATDPRQFAPAVRAAIQHADPALPLGLMLTMAERIDGSVGTPRFRTALIGCFALLAGVLASLGVYAVRAQTVAGRRREMGIRLALGATRAQVFGLVMQQGFREVALGLAVGVGAAWVLAGAVEPWLFATQPMEPRLVATALALLALGAVAATWAPARRAAIVDPAITLRTD